MIKQRQFMIKQRQVMIKQRHVMVKQRHVMMKRHHVTEAYRDSWKNGLWLLGDDCSAVDKQPFLAS